MRGLDITFVTTAKSNDEGHALLKELGLPFRKNQKDAEQAQAA